MMEYEARVLGQLEVVASRSGRLVSRHVCVGGGGRLIAHDDRLRTAATVDYVFGEHRVRMSVDSGAEPGAPPAGPRGPSMFWWVPGDRADDGELRRLFRAWGRATGGLGASDVVALDVARAVREVDG